MSWPDEKTCLIVFFYIISYQTWLNLIINNSVIEWVFLSNSVLVVGWILQPFVLSLEKKKKYNTSMNAVILKICFV